VNNLNNKTTGADVLSMLIPTGGWVIYGDDFDSIIWDEGVLPITQKEFIDGFDKATAWKAEQNAAEITKKETAAAKLAALGLTPDDLKALGLGSS
jgi:hypothetical protein